MSQSYTVSAVSLGISAATTTGTGSSAVTTCGSGRARLRRIERKGTSTIERRQFVLKDGPIVDVVNPDPIEFEEDVKIRLGFDETGLHVVLNNVCE
jgi:hypothetical protein